jgi:hypothetical protein
MFHDSVVRFVERGSGAGVPTVLFDEPVLFHVDMILMQWLHATQHLYAEPPDASCSRYIRDGCIMLKMSVAAQLS